MNTREQFQKQEKLSQFWASIIGDGRFDQVLTYARSAIVEQAPTREELRGVELAFHTLETIGTVDHQPFNFPSPGITHEVERMPARPTETKQPAKTNENTNRPQSQRRRTARN